MLGDPGPGGLVRSRHLRRHHVQQRHRLRDLGRLATTIRSTNEGGQKAALVLSRGFPAAAADKAAAAAKSPRVRGGGVGGEAPHMRSVVFSERKTQGRRDSNPRPTVLE